jgi:NAD(P)-dependent dehydrogenase (short-subunit alcohol dehydrogenase family)
LRLKDKVAVVTGSGRGIGRAIALAFAREGASLVINAVNLDHAESVAEEIRALGREALPLKADVSNGREVRNLVESTIAQFRKIDVLVNNAGISRPGPIEDLSEEDWDTTMNVNLKGTFLCSKAVGNEMIKRSCGVIINISSIGGLTPVAWGGAYSPSKAGMVMLTRLLAMEWARYKIRVNSICPNIVRNGMISEAYGTEEALTARSRAIPLGRLAKAEDVANVAVFLASDDSSYITGEAITVDGGQMSSIYNFLLTYKKAQLGSIKKSPPSLPYG